jgi:hypothetical protein
MMTRRRLRWVAGAASAGGAAGGSRADTQLYKEER